MTATARVGVIGCGWWSSNAHLPALHRNPQAAIVALADKDPSALSRAATRYGVTQTFSSTEELVAGADVDALVIAIPHAYHYEAARTALQHGIHVLLEKPMVLDPEHGRTLLAEARRRGVGLVVGYPWHYNQQVLAVRSAIAAGDIGEIEFASCLFASIVRELYRGNPDAYSDLFAFASAATPGTTTYSDPAIAGGGQGQTQVTHASALLFWLTGLRPSHVLAQTESFELAVDLADSIAIRFEGGALGSLASTGSILPGHDEVLEYRIFGRDGHVLFDVNGGTCSIHRRSGEVRTLAPLALPDRYPESAPVDNLVGLVLGEMENGSPPEIGQMAVEFLDAMYRSARSGARVALQGDPAAAR